jgi:hypothetical protein
MTKKLTARMTACGALLFALGLPPAHANVEAAPEASQSKMPGRMDLLLRTYAEELQYLGGSRRHAVIQSGRLIYQSDYYSAGSDLSVGVDAGLYGALRLDGGGGSRNMIHHRVDGTGTNDHAWAFLGEYALKAKLGQTTVKYGLQPGVDNPFMPPYDIRALPPTFRGITAVSTDIPGVKLSAGSFDGVIPRGDDRVRPLSTSYSEVQFDRISYAGVETRIKGVKTAFHVNHATNLWNQYFISASKDMPVSNDVTLTGRMDTYITNATGARIGGEIDNKALGLSLTVEKGASSVLFGYQSISGDQFYDYTNETAGITLSNAMGVDYNSPHERSGQLRYVFNGDRAGIPGLRLMAFTVHSYGANAAAGAAAHSNVDDPLHNLYWKKGQPARGGRYEYAGKVTYQVQSGALKDMRIAFYVYRTRADPFYPGSSFNDSQLMINFPVRVF